eukprot:6214545-Pleurochrysis_carterae.AAC.1
MAFLLSSELTPPWCCIKYLSKVKDALDSKHLASTSEKCAWALRRPVLGSQQICCKSNGRSISAVGRAQTEGLSSLHSQQCFSNMKKRQDYAFRRPFLVSCAHGPALSALRAAPRAPRRLAYGDRGSPPKIGGGDVLVFTIEILKIKGGKKPAVKCDVETLKDCSDKEAKYVGAKKELKAAEIDAEMERLKGLSSKKMAEAQAGWVDRRLFLLGKIKGAAKAEL